MRFHCIIIYAQHSHNTSPLIEQLQSKTMLSQSTRDHLFMSVHDSHSLTMVTINKQDMFLDKPKQQQ